MAQAICSSLAASGTDHSGWPGLVTAGHEADRAFFLCVCHESATYFIDAEPVICSDVGELKTSGFYLIVLHIYCAFVEYVYIIKLGLIAL